MNFYFYILYHTTKGQRVGPYLLTEPIGSGSYGTVWRAVNVQLHGEPDLNAKQNDTYENKYVAIKVVSKLEHTSIESRARLAREASIMNSLDHPLMADLFYFMEDETNSYLAMEYLENSSLLDLINSTIEECEEEDLNNNENFEQHKDNAIINGNNQHQNSLNAQCSISNAQSDVNFKKKVFKIQALDENIVRKIFVQLIVALEFLHNVQHVAHRDIKAENVLLDRYNNIRIIDFGLSAIVQDDKSLKRTVGSVAYTAPEILLKKPYSKSADIWSAGVLLYALSTSRLPFIGQSNLKIISSSKNTSNSNFKNNSQKSNNSSYLSRSMNRSSFYDVYNDPKKMCHMIRHGKLSIPETLSPDLQDLLGKMLEKDPNKRITIKEIEQHPFFSIEQYNMLIDFVKRQDKVEDIDLKLDPEIVSEMEARGMNCELLPQLLFLQELNEVTAAYKEMKKVKVVKDLSRQYDKIQLYSKQSSGLNSISNQIEDQNSDENEKNNVQRISDETEINNQLNNVDSPENCIRYNKVENQFFFGRNLYKIVHDDNYEDSSENNTDNDSENIAQQTFKKSQSVVISELNLHFLHNTDDPPSVQTLPPLNDNIKKANYKAHLIPHSASPRVDDLPQTAFIHSQMTKSQTSSLIFTPNEHSDGTNSKIVPKSYMRPRIHLGLTNV